VTQAVEERIRTVEGLAAGLDARGFARIEGLLEPEASRALAALYEDDARFRSRVVMARHGYGQGEYRYFGYPLPAAVEALRTALYARLAPIANRWQAALGRDVRFPDDHADFLARCHAAGQKRPTPLLLHYETGDYNCLHQDRYGEHFFPLQVAILLAEPGRDFTGGEFLLSEQRARRQTRTDVVPLRRGDAVVFASADRPGPGVRGPIRVQHRHGVATVRSGRRRTLGIIFHDAA